MNPLQIVEATFSLVNTGNCTAGHVIEDGSLDSSVKVYKTGIRGFGILNTITGTILDVYGNRESAQESIARRLAK